MSFVRLLMLVVAVLAAVVVGLAVFRPDPDASPAPQTLATPPVNSPARTVAAPPRSGPSQVTSPGDASSPAEITAQEAAEAVRRLEREQEENVMMVPDETPADLTSSW